MAVSAFVRETDTRIAADAVLALSEQESRRFLAALDEPFSPNARLEMATEEAY
jgi:uncharacterized protein (DUF1778 family)